MSCNAATRIIALLKEVNRTKLWELAVSRISFTDSVAHFLQPFTQQNYAEKRVRVNSVLCSDSRVPSLSWDDNASSSVGNATCGMLPRAMQSSKRYIAPGVPVSTVSAEANRRLRKEHT